MEGNRRHREHCVCDEALTHWQVVEVLLLAFLLPGLVRTGSLALREVRGDEALRDKERQQTQDD